MRVASLRFVGSCLLLFGAPACQRLEDDEPFQPTSLGDGGTGDDDGGTFTPADDDGDSTGGDGGGPSSECDPGAQTGCAQGEKCTVIVGGMGPTFVCVGAGGSTLEPFDPCQADPAAGLDSCPIGTACVGATTSGVCVHLCTRDSDCEQGVCGVDPVNDIQYCAADCSPFESSCPAPMACRRNGERFSCGFLEDTDIGGPTAPCDSTDDSGCAAGLMCITGSLVPECASPGCCAPLCDLSGADPCAAPATCSAAIGSPAPGFEEIGACFVPA